MVHIMFQEMESRKNIVHVLSVVVQVSGVDSDPMASRLHWQTGSGTVLTFQVQGGKRSLRLLVLLEQLEWVLSRITLRASKIP